MKSRHLFVVLAAAICFAALTRAQAPARPAFEAASVKRNTTGPRGLSNVLLAGGRYVGSGPTVRSMTVFVYAPLLTRQVVGGPDWLDTERYDVQAKAEGNPSGDTLRKMLQELLADRFKLRAHMETRESPAYFLIRARTDGRLGPQLKPGTVNCTDHQGSAPPPDAVPPTLPPLECGLRTSTRNFAAAGIQIVNAGKGVTIAQLASQFSTFGPVGRLVIDHTGLAGTYDVEVSFSAGSGGTTEAAASIFTAVQEQLGLKLESTTAPVDYLVIDGAERPTEN